MRHGLRPAWLNLWDKHMTTGRINQIAFSFLAERHHDKPGASVQTRNFPSFSIRIHSQPNSLDFSSSQIRVPSLQQPLKEARRRFNTTLSHHSHINSMWFLWRTSRLNHHAKTRGVKKMKRKKNSQYFNQTSKRRESDSQQQAGAPWSKLTTIKVWVHRIIKPLKKKFFFLARPSPPHICHGLLLGWYPKC